MAALPKLLLGPPAPKTSADSSSARTKPPKGRTENSSATYLSSGDPCLYLFFHIVPDTPSSYINKQLPKSWAHNALTTLKLICNLRGVRGTGKSDKEAFFTAAFWLHTNHPKTLACNLASFADFGCFKDLPEILYRLLEGQDIKRSVAAVFNKGKRPRYSSRREPREERVVNATERAKSEKEKASVLRKQKFAAMANKAVSRYERDPDYRFLHERVSDVFAECLKSDLENLNSAQLNRISLAAKWCPSLDSSFDRATLLCERIARKVFPRESCPEYDGVLEEHYAYRVRDRLRKEVLVPLRKALELPEVYMGAQKWSSVPYNRVASVAMKLYKETFFKHDIVRFSKYLVDVKAGEGEHCGRCAAAARDHRLEFERRVTELRSFSGREWWRI
ncbi:hypothetical protein M0R45_024844 [Rubus argutus]|uniref:DUF2828 domain-containing protein n=1 Tax=Rubus argutus TaxID=59490 RepID=A0AAW1WTQ1_RUBAR